MSTARNRYTSMVSPPVHHLSHLESLKEQFLALFYSWCTLMICQSVLHLLLICLLMIVCCNVVVVSSAEDAAKLQQDLTNLQKWEDDWLMSFNPHKCEVLSVTNKKKTYPATYSICGQELKQIDSAKYLSVDIDSQLTWNRHIDCITKKANGNKAFLQRNTSCPRKIKANCYTTVVRPSPEYASSVWSPHTQKNIKKLASVQRRSARYVINDLSCHSSVTAMIQHLE